MIAMQTKLNNSQWWNWYFCKHNKLCWLFASQTLLLFIREKYMFSRQFMYLSSKSCNQNIINNKALQECKTLFFFLLFCLFVLLSRHHWRLSSFQSHSFCTKFKSQSQCSLQELPGLLLGKEQRAVPKNQKSWFWDGTEFKICCPFSKRKSRSTFLWQKTYKPKLSAFWSEECQIKVIYL